VWTAIWVTYTVVCVHLSASSFCCRRGTGTAATPAGTKLVLHSPSAASMRLRASSFCCKAILVCARYVYVNAFTCGCRCVFAWACLHARSRVHVRVYVSVRVRVHACVHACVRACACLLAPRAKRSRLRKLRANDGVGCAHRAHLQSRQLRRLRLRLFRFWRLLLLLQWRPRTSLQLQQHCLYRYKKNICGHSGSEGELFHTE
jgi:hypothetical protein